MFGMDDPAKVVVQIRSYIEEGRYEIAEVMAQELSTHLLHSKRDIDRRLDSSREEYYNGAIFGLDPTKSPEEVDENWSVRVIPNDDYLQSPRLAGSAWKHIERRKMGD